MSFMKLKVIQDTVYVVETNFGTEYVPESVVGKMVSEDDLAQYVDGRIESVEIEHNKWLARLSADGFMDQTDLTCHDTELAAWMSLVEQYPEAFTWAVEFASETPTAHIHMASGEAAIAMAVAVQSIGGSKIEQDGAFLYAAISDPAAADKELTEAGFSTTEAP